jgi:hypothetical protein
MKTGYCIYSIQKRLLGIPIKPSCFNPMLMPDHVTCYKRLTNTSHKPSTNCRHCNADLALMPKQAIDAWLNRTTDRLTWELTSLSALWSSLTPPPPPTANTHSLFVGRWKWRFMNKITHRSWTQKRIRWKQNNERRKKKTYEIIQREYWYRGTITVVRGTIRYTQRREVIFDRVKENGS